MARAHLTTQKTIVSSRITTTRCLEILCLGLLAIVMLGDVRAVAQYDMGDEVLVPKPITDCDIEIRGRYVREMRLDESTRVLLFDNNCQVNFGPRQMSANNAVVWITATRTEKAGIPYFELSIYLSGNARLLDLGGTLTQDDVLYVSNIKTSRKVIKYHDAFVEEDISRLPLYQQAQQTRDAVLVKEQDKNRPQVFHPRDVFAPEREPVDDIIKYDIGPAKTVVTPGGMPVVVATEHIYFSQRGDIKTPVLEIQADTGVFFLDKKASDGETTPEAVESLDLTKQTPIAIYLEGDIRISVGTRYIRAERFYYDVVEKKGLVLDAVYREEIPGRDIPIYVRADEVRMLSQTEYSATNAKVTTSEFFTPHYHIGAQHVNIIDRSEHSADGKPFEKIAGSIALEHTTFNIGGVPIAYWPYSRTDIELTAQVLRSFSTSYDSEYGVSTESKWYLYNLLGIEKPEGYDATLELDYFADRGPAIGVNGDYERETYLGLLRSYFVYDKGEDDLGPLRQDENRLTTETRGRFTWRHHHYLANDWEAILELSYISDPNFLETYEHREFWEGKEQETLIYLKRARETDAITFLTQWRLLDFLTQTEHLPEITYYRIGDTFADPVILYHESRLGAVRYRIDERNVFEERLFSNQGNSDLTTRFDLRQEAELPIKLPYANIVPFASVRGTHWDGQPLADGSLTRGLGVYGVRGSTGFYRVFNDVESELFDIHRIRHIVKPDFAVWWAHSNIDDGRIQPFDYGIESPSDIYGGTVGIRQVWQTKRGVGDKQRTSDLLTFDLEAGFFGNVEGEEQSNGWANTIRPEDSRPRNYINGEMIYRLSDSTSLLYDFNIDVNDWEFDRHNASLAVERSPRLAYFLGYRQAGDIDYKLLGGGFNYKINQKHTVASRAYYDLDRNKIGEVAVVYIRKLPRWYFSVSFEWDDVFDDVSLGISFWPEGIPEWTIGSRRFTRLGTATGLRP